MTERIYRVTKSWNHENGPSVCFRNWRAKGHCKVLHGYALGISVVFAGRQLDNCNWLVDFDAIEELHTSIITRFCHKTIVAEDDPDKDLLNEMEARELVELEWLDDVSIERIAEAVFEMAQLWLHDNILERLELNQLPYVEKVTVFENYGNAASWCNQYSGED